ncbi:ABC transporter ATP-binding protein [Pseudalkalibacillus hwajinpoensis]|uniref:ABC transporter ATP-binding protein n=1 Tax=Guptibacillus hwajinpoensis TaxID=208199 RepID=A0A4V5PY52_9BACL|nr:ABC transporter ATP-binding protein [Pseudalkalibacillus hwajinpoensis]TKD68698.1 ABC transporter ATP-binding protein [Pseudalkalibacillus hwajinpoensis]
MTNSILEVSNLTGGYQANKPVLHDLSLNVGPNEIVGLIGLNGAGKSTSIKHILGLLDPMEGNIRVAGKTFSEDKDGYRKQLSYIPETPLLYDELTLWEHLQLTALAYELGNDWKDRAEDLLKEFRMTNMKKWFPGHFSKGMRQKVMIMCAFLVRPSLYIVDEPFVGLDPIGIQSFLDTMLQVKEEGAGVLMSTHILSTAERYCDRFIILHDGVIVMSGTLKELRNQIGQSTATLDDIYIEATRSGK